MIKTNKLYKKTMKQKEVTNNQKNKKKKKKKGGGRREFLQNLASKINELQAVSMFLTCNEY